MGIKTIRYTNYQVLNDIDFVTNDLFEKIKLREVELLLSPFSRENSGLSGSGFKLKRV